MKFTQDIHFIKGTFTPSEARELLVDLITHKINFHSLKNFSSEERFGKPVKGSKKRIDELKSSREKFIRLIEKAVEQKANLKIESDIKIEFEK